jgi:hypothetical protein
MKNFKIITEGNKKFEIHDERIEKGPLFEVISFTGNDGIKVVAKHELRDINKYSVNRRLDDVFQISYHILLPKNGFSELYDIDQQVVSYVKSITKRDNR